MSDRKHGLRISVSVALALATALVVMTSCIRYSNVPRADWSSGSSDGQEEWKVNTSTTIYCVRRFSTTDSTLVLEDAYRREAVGGTTYPRAAMTAIEESELPIVLRFDEVVSVEHGEFSRGRTIGAFLGVAAATCVVASFALWMYLGEHYPSD